MFVERGKPEQNDVLITFTVVEEIHLSLCHLLQRPAVAQDASGLLNTQCRISVSGVMG